MAVPPPVLPPRPPFNYVTNQRQGDIFFNYGCFPRTWEDPEHVHPDTKFPGDNDPLDVCEIGLRIVATGDVRQVKVLGVLAMIDEGEGEGKRRGVVVCLEEASS